MFIKKILNNEKRLFLMITYSNLVLKAKGELVRTFPGRRFQCKGDLGMRFNPYCYLDSAME